MIHGGRRTSGRQYDRTARAVVLDLLSRKNATAYEMAEAAQRDTQTIYGLVGRLRKCRQIHIADWRRGRSGPARAVYGLGDFEDAPRPKPFSQSEKCRRWRAKKSIPLPKCPVLRALLLKKVA